MASTRISVMNTLAACMRRSINRDFDASELERAADALILHLEALDKHYGIVILNQQCDETRAALTTARDELVTCTNSARAIRASVQEQTAKLAEALHDVSEVHNAVGNAMRATDSVLLAARAERPNVFSVSTSVISEEK